MSFEKYRTKKYSAVSFLWLEDGWNLGMLRGKITLQTKRAPAHYRYWHSQTCFGKHQFVHKKCFLLKNYESQEAALEAAKEHQIKHLFDVSGFSGCYKIQGNHVKMAYTEPPLHTPKGFFTFDLKYLNDVKQHFWYFDGEHVHTYIDLKKCLLPHFIHGPGHIIYSDRPTNCRDSSCRVSNRRKYKKPRSFWSQSKQGYVVRIRRNAANHSKFFSLKKYFTKERASQAAEQYINEFMAEEEKHWQ
jgi:hypothetical protein